METAQSVVGAGPGQRRARSRRAGECNEAGRTYGVIDARGLEHAGNEHLRRSGRREDRIDPGKTAAGERARELKIRGGAVASAEVHGRDRVVDNIGVLEEIAPAANDVAKRHQRLPFLIDDVRTQDIVEQFIPIDQKAAPAERDALA